jgi:hypothetical protein
MSADALAFGLVSRCLGPLQPAAPRRGAAFPCRSLEGGTKVLELGVRRDVFAERITLLT